MARRDRVEANQVVVGKILYREDAMILWGDKVEIFCHEYRVYKLTPRGMWLVDTKYEHKTWRALPTRFAWLTKPEARASLIARSTARYGHAERRLDEARKVLVKLGQKPPTYDDLVIEDWARVQGLD